MITSMSSWSTSPQSSKLFFNYLETVLRFSFSAKAFVVIYFSETFSLTVNDAIELEKGKSLSVISPSVISITFALLIEWGVS